MSQKNINVLVEIQVYLEKWVTIPILLVRCYHGPYLAEKTFVISWHRPYIAILVVYFPSFPLTSKPIKIEHVTDLSRVARFVKKVCTITKTRV